MIINIRRNVGCEHLIPANPGVISKSHSPPVPGITDAGNEYHGTVRLQILLSFTTSSFQPPPSLLFLNNSKVKAETKQLKEFEPTVQN